MNAGRELDALIAEKVMGLTVERDSPYSVYLRISGRVAGLPNYSTDIAAAWEVAENLKARMTHFQVHSVPGGWTARTFRVPAGLSAESLADTAPHAICLAALQAVGVQT